MFRGNVRKNSSCQKAREPKECCFHVTLVDFPKTFGHWMNLDSELNERLVSCVLHVLKLDDAASF